MKNRGNFGALEPYYGYKVTVKDIFGDIKSFKILARSEYEARERVYAKFMQFQPDLQEYSFGVRTLI